MNTQINNRNVQFGTVRFFKVSEGYGFIIPDGGGSDIHFRIEASRRITVGDEGPVFEMGHIPFPQGNARVAFVLPPHMTTVSVWGYQSYWDLAKQKAARYPVIRIVRRDAFKNDRCDRPAKVVFGGATLPALIKMLQSGVVTYCSTAVDGSKTTTQWFEERNPNGSWEKVVNDLTLASLEGYDKSDRALAA